MIQRHLILPLSLLFILTGCAKQNLVQENRFLMNTVVSIKVPHSTHQDTGAAIDKSFRRIKEIGNLMNRYYEDSECASINRLKFGDVIRISPEMVFVLRRSLELYRVTEGAFDVTISPLIDLWGSYKKKEAIPTEEEIKIALSKIGSENILIDDDRSLRFNRDGVKIDLSGIAKGYAVDEAIRVLKENGIRNGLVNAGGDMYCLGEGPDRKGWRVGIRHPRKSELLGTLILVDKAVATSGDYQDFFIVNEKRYSHILDPRSGYPVSDIPMSVTVVGPDCITVDGLATAISVMGPGDGLRLAEKLDGIEAIVVSKDGDKLRIDATTGVKDIYESL